MFSVAAWNLRPWADKFLYYINKVRCYEAQIEESEKGRQPPGVEPRTPLAWAASALPLSHNSRTTTNPHNPLCILHRWYWMPQSRTRWREFSGRPLTEFWRHILSGCRVRDWGIQYHLCSIHRGLWGLVVVRLLWLSGRALAAQARGVLGSTPGGCWPFSLSSIFVPHNI